MAESSPVPDPSRPITPVLSIQSLHRQIGARELLLAAHRQQMPVIQPKENRS